MRTTYSVSRSALMTGDITQSSRQQETRYHLEETFDGFEVRGGLGLPSLWTLRFGAEGEGLPSSVWRYDTTFERLRLNVVPSAETGPRQR